MGKVSTETDKAFKVTLPGYDVDTATPEQCAVHSGFDYPKIEESLEGYITATPSSSIGTGFEVIATIDHNYGYIPTVLVFLDDINDHYKTDFAILPFAPYVPITWNYSWRITETTLTIGVYNDGTGGNLVPEATSPANVEVGFKYQIWVND